MKTIGIVEDNADNMLLLDAILGADYSLMTFENGPTALAGFPGSVVDLILLDISLPGMDGIEVLHRLRESDQFKNLPIIALTAHAMAGDRERFLKVGFDGYYSKPIVDMQDFKTAIAAYLK